ncbi:unnamed protein product [Cunninghamella blakesleeana]
MMDPVKLLGKDVWELRGNIKKLLGSGHPFMKTLAKHYLSSDTERIRPLLILLMAKATNMSHVNNHINESTNTNDDNQNLISEKQRRLAEISEMIHISSLLHYDILDDNENTTNVFGNKMAVLAGDFLLARASLALAQLRNAECIELMATCIANLVEGEVMHVKKGEDGHIDSTTNQQQQQHEQQDQISDLDYYLHQSYLKTGSLIAQSCKSSAVLSGADKDVTKIAYDYGKHIGLAIQLISDLQVFAKKAATLDHLSINAPLLFASEEFPELKQIIKGNFSHEDDLEKARNLVYQSHGLKRTIELADIHKQQAIKAIQKLPTSRAQVALIQLAKNVGN